MSLRSVTEKFLIDNELGSVELDFENTLFNYIYYALMQFCLFVHACSLFLGQLYRVEIDISAASKVIRKIASIVSSG